MGVDACIDPKTGMFICKKAVKINIPYETKSWELCSDTMFNFFTVTVLMLITLYLDNC